MKFKKGKSVRIKKLARKPKKILIIRKNQSRQKKNIFKNKLKSKPKLIKNRIKEVVGQALKIKHSSIRLKTRKKTLRLHSEQVKKVKLLNSKPSFLAESFFKAKIKVIGIGGGGGSIVSEIGRSLHKATFVIADTDIRAFKKRAGIKYFLFGQKLTHGLGTGVNPNLGRIAAEQEKERIAHFFDDQDIVIFVASLGGGLGSGATQVFAKACENFNGITFGIFTLPFKFEGKTKYKIALKALRELRKSLNVSITMPNERIFKVMASDTAITDAFSMVNKNLIESLESLIDLIYSPGIINIDFADLRAILKGKGNLAFLNTAEAQGKNRVQEIAQKILRNPLYQNNNFTAQKILFNIEGGNNLSMFEVDKISRAIAQQNKKAKIIFGISKNLKYKNKIKTTLLMTNNALEDKIVVPKKALQGASLASKKVFNIKGSFVKSKEKNILKNMSKKGPKARKKPAKKQTNHKKIPFVDTLVPVFNNIPLVDAPAESGIKNLNVIEVPVNRKKNIRRSALEIKKAQEQEENKQSVQEKEWEIPAFLRKIKFKP